MLVLAILAPAAASAGSYVFAGETNGVDIVTHPSGYLGTGGVIEVEVCIDAGAPDAAAMEIPVQNIVQQINAMTAASPNLVFGAANNIPSGVVDFESLTLHELGHCTGLAHPNLGFIPGVVEGSNTDFTQATDGVNNGYAFDTGTDGVYGSSDDQRGDDLNLHWFEKNVNNPFLDVANPQASSYSRDPADLPAGHAFPSNAGRGVGALLAVPDTEAVMQQGQYYDEDQRRLQADDVATYRMAMTGLDEIAGTADDYTLRMVYGGIQADTSGCDIKIEAQTTGFGVCSIGGSFIGPNHVRITNATFRYNSNLNWFFNQEPASGCGATNADLTFVSVTHDGAETHDACNSITYGPTYEVGPAGSVTATAPEIVVGNGSTIRGEFTAISAMP